MRSKCVVFRETCQQRTNGNLMLINSVEGDVCTDCGSYILKSVGLNVVFAQAQWRVIVSPCDVQRLRLFEPVGLDASDCVERTTHRRTPFCRDYGDGLLLTNVVGIRYFEVVELPSDFMLCNVYASMGVSFVVTFCVLRDKTVRRANFVVCRGTSELGTDAKSV